MKNFKPYTSTRRHAVLTNKEHVWKGSSEKSLTKKYNSKAGTKHIIPVKINKNDMDKLMNLENLMAKNIDENKQGKSLTLKNNPDSFRKMYIESYGCQMNFSDSEIVASILKEESFTTTQNISEADLVFVNTCSIREKAEQTIRKRLEFYNSIKKNENKGMIVGVLGCMAERLKDQLLEEEKLVDIVIGPDAYRDLPNLIKQVDDGRKAVNVMLSRE